MENTVKAISDAQKTHKVLLVYLNVDPETTVRRRANPQFIKSKLPFSDEMVESTRLHNVLGTGTRKFLENTSALRDLCLPILEVENNGDGEDFMEFAVSAIMNFIKRNI